MAHVCTYRIFLVLVLVLGWISLSTSAVLTLRNFEVAPVKPALPAQPPIAPQQWYLNDITGEEYNNPDINEDEFMAIFNNIGRDPKHDQPLKLAYNEWEPPISESSEFGPLRLAPQHGAPYAGYTFKFRKAPGSPLGPLTFGERVALLLHVPKDSHDPDGDAWVRGWLYYRDHSPRTRQQIFLSFAPQYQWALDGGPTGTPIKQTHTPGPHDIVGIYNTVRQDHLIYCEGRIEDADSPGISVDLGWMRDCGRSDEDEDADEEVTRTIFLTAQPIVQGNRPYVVSWPPIGTINGHLKEIHFPASGVKDLVLRFVRFGHTTAECGNPSAVVALAEGQTTTPTQLEQIFGTPQPEFPITFVACLGVVPGAPILERVPINITYALEE